MSDPLLTAAMIVRDEAAHLPACLESILGVVDDIVIVDTGSSDATVSIARSFGARVHAHPWREDFAAARNAGLDLARGAWILYVDADERLRPISAERVRSTLEEATEVALRVRLSPFAGATPYWEYRLWRSDPRVRFTGRMHEKVTSSIGAVAAADRLMVGESELFLDHVGYGGDQTRKHARNLPLLRAQLAADPTNSYNWRHLSAALKGLGEAGESEVALEQAVQTARDSGRSAGALAFVDLIERRRGHGDEVTVLLDEALAHYPDNVALAWHKACSEIRAGRYQPALHWLERFDADTNMPIEDTIAYPAELFAARAPEARGGCLFSLARYREAAAAYRQAEEFEPGQPAHRLKRLLSEHRAARQAGDAPGAEASRSGDDHRWLARELLPGLAVDVGGVSVGLSATDAMRAGAVRAVLGRMAPSDEDPVVRLAFGSHRVPPPERSPDETQGDLRLWHDGVTLSVAYGTSVGARVESGRGSLGGYASDVTRVFRHVAPFLLASLLAPHGRFVLHGGAIARNGRAVLILGDSGLGKSTLVLGALQDDWRVLSDDLVLARCGPSGPAVSGIPRTLAVPREIVPDSLAAWPLHNDPRGRLHVPFVPWDRAWFPITAVVVVGHGDGERAAIESIERPGLLGLAVRSMLSRQTADVRRYFNLATMLSELPAWRLLHSRAPEMRARRAAQALSAHLTRPADQLV